MKIVFDTNVLISAFLTTTGPSQYVFTMALKRHNIILSEYILKELKEKLTDKLAFPQDKVKAVIDFLKVRTAILEVSGKAGISFSDPKDLPILRLLEVSQADCFITGDKRLLGLKKHGPTSFLSPREAMAIFAK